MHDKMCCVPNCGKKREDNVILHKFPNPNKNYAMFTTWINAIGGEIILMDPNDVYKNRRVCRDHFRPNFISCSDRICPNAVPTIGISGFTILHTREPLTEITNKNCFELNTIEPDQDKNKDVLNFFDKQSSCLSAPSTSLAERKATCVGNKNICFTNKEIALGNTIKNLRNKKQLTKSKMNKTLKLTENPKFIKVMKKFCSEANKFIMLQFREVKKKLVGRRFTMDEKVLALALYKQGPRAYRWLRKMFVLPSSVTLSRMISNASLKPGINENIFLELLTKSKKMKEKEKLCVLLFDEISISPNFFYNRRKDEVTGFVNNGQETKLKIADHALVFMIRGLYKNYKQPLMYTFCGSSTTTNDLVVQIKTIITKIFQIGFRVVATICDQGASNVSAINFLINETKNKYIRQNKELRQKIFEIDGEEVIPLYDPPHLIKGVRNNLLNKNLKFEIDGEEKLAKWEHIISLYNENPGYKGIRLMPKLTDKHVVPDKIPKMKVKCATQVFSQTVAAQMGFLASVGLLPKECQDTADLILFVDNLFDSFNGSYKAAVSKGAKCLLQPVTPKSNHHQIWTKSLIILKSMKFINKDKLNSVPSILNWIQTISNTKYMIEQLFKKYNLTSIWMRHFNQDPLENFFGSIRSHGCRNTNPTCSGFETAFAALLINNLSSNYSLGSNCEKDSCTIFKSLKKIFFVRPVMSSCTTEVDYSDINNEFEDIDEKIKDPKKRAQLEYVTGYVLRKLKLKVFKNCRKCKIDLFSQDVTESSLKFREFFKNKHSLTYPSKNIIQIFSNIQDIVINILRTQPNKKNIKNYAKTICAVTLNYSLFDCEIHKKDNISNLEDLCLDLFLFTWCKDTNKLIHGLRKDCDKDDLIQKMAVDYARKRKK